MKRYARRLIRSDAIAGLNRWCEEDRSQRYQGEPPTMIAVVTQDPSVPSALPTVDSWDWFTSTHEQRAPAWKNQVTLRSVEMFLDYEPGAHIAHISPTPLLMIGALADHLTAAGGHFDSYTQDFEIAHSEAIQ